MNIGLVLGLLKVAIETFQDERKDRFLKQWVKLEREHNEEMSKYPPTIENIKKHKAKFIRSDLALDNILLDCESLAKLVISERNK